MSSEQKLVGTFRGVTPELKTAFAFRILRKNQAF